jgi:hypothetical protein
MFWLKDQRKWNEANRNEGKITQEAYERRENELYVEHELLRLAVMEANTPIAQEAWALVNKASRQVLTPEEQAHYNTLNELSQFLQDQLNRPEKRIEPLWGGGTPGWPPDQKMRESLNFALRKPNGIRASYRTNSAYEGFSIYITPYTGQTYNNLKQQLEAGLGTTLTRNPNYIPGNANTTEYTYELRSNRSGNGKTYYIGLTHGDPNCIIVGIWEP